MNLQAIRRALSYIHPGLRDNEAHALYHKHEETPNRSVLGDILKSLL